PRDVKVVEPWHKSVTNVHGASVPNGTLHTRATWHANPMIPFFSHSRTVMRASVLLPCVAVLVLTAVRGGPAHVSTFGAIAAVAIGVAAVMAGTWAHAQPVASLRQQLYDIDHPLNGDAGTWEQRVAAGDRSGARGRALAA